MRLQGKKTLGNRVEYQLLWFSVFALILKKIFLMMYFWNPVKQNNTLKAAEKIQALERFKCESVKN